MRNALWSIFLPLLTASCSLLAPGDDKAPSAVESTAQCPVCSTAPSCTSPPNPAKVASINELSTAKEPQTQPATLPTGLVSQPKAKLKSQVEDINPELKVKRLVLAHGVKDREPVEPAETFAADSTKRIYAFVEVRNAERLESAIFVTFEREKGPARGQVRLRIGESPRWRTWAYTRAANQAGLWWAVVRDTQGKELARKSFEVTATTSEKVAAKQAPDATDKAPALAAEKTAEVAKKTATKTAEKTAEVAEKTAAKAAEKT